VIRIKPSPTADTRSCDYKNVSKDQLYESSVQHIADVNQALAFFCHKVRQSGQLHDYDKLSYIDRFHADFLTGFKQHDWWDQHRQINRHHLTMEDGIPADVNLIDVLDFIADCVMAGMARTGEVYPLELPNDLLQRAFQNTVSMLKSEVVVDREDPQ